MKIIHVSVRLFWFASSLSVICAWTSCAVGGGSTASTTSAADTAAPTSAGTSTDGTTSTSTSAGGPPAAFITGFYAFATVPSSCIQCHGVSQVPLFAVSDATAACNALLPYVDMTTPASSMVVAYAGNGHCGIESVCGSNSPTVTTDIQAWATAVAAEGPSGSPCSTLVTTTTGTTGTTGSTGSPVSTLNCPAGTVPPSAAITYTTGRSRFQRSSAFDRHDGRHREVEPLDDQPGSGHRHEFCFGSPGPESERDHLSGYFAENARSDEFDRGGGTACSGERLRGSGYRRLGRDQCSTTIAPTTIPNPLPTTSINATALSTEAVLSLVQTTSDKISIGFEKLVGQ